MTHDLLDSSSSLTLFRATPAGNHPLCSRRRRCRLSTLCRRHWRRTRGWSRSRHLPSRCCGRCCRFHHPMLECEDIGNNNTEYGTDRLVVFPIRIIDVRHSLMVACIFIAAEHRVIWPLHSARTSICQLYSRSPWMLSKSRSEQRRRRFCLNIDVRHSLMEAYTVITSEHRVIWPLHGASTSISQLYSSNPWMLSKSRSEQRRRCFCLRDVNIRGRAQQGQCYVNLSLETLGRNPLPCRSSRSQRIAVCIKVHADTSVR